MRRSTLFSRKWRLTDAYSARTLDQAHSSSLQIIFDQEVNVCCPISLWATRIVTVSSGATTSQGLISASSFRTSDSHGLSGIFAVLTAASAGLGGKARASAKPPPTVSVVTMNSLRSIPFVDAM